jgi:predicted O-linked N-acetylglucosamine transferase (SPINDLY family)
MIEQTVQQMYGRALTLHNVGHLRDAEEACRQILLRSPNVAEVHNLLGAALQGQGRQEEALAEYRIAVSLNPNLAPARYNLGTSLHLANHVDEAIPELRRALALDPNFFEAWNNLGNALEDKLAFDEAAEAYRQALRLRPNAASVVFNLGNALRDTANPDGAIEAYRRAIAREPNYVEAKHNLAAVLKDAGGLDESIEIWEALLKTNPVAFIASNYIYSLHFHPDYDAKRLYEVHADWNRRYAEPLAPERNGDAASLITSCVPVSLREFPTHRRLRIGYVSPDLREHPVGRFLLPLLEHHDRRRFEIFCYTDVRQTDAITDRLRSHSDVWRSTIGLSNDQLVQLVRDDRIDILVDLTMHMKGSRLLAFARKPAPVQVTYLAYCGTTGLRTMDYRLTDPFLDSPGEDRSVYSEQSVWLRSYWCYEPAADAPAVAPPSASTGSITFGCLNNFGKVTPGTLDVWAELLSRVPGSRLLLFAPEGSHRERARQRLAGRNVDPRRLAFVPLMHLNQYLSQYNHIDIGLDPFPYPGGTTTCDALWMGVPVVSLAGATAVSRAGLSILSQMGLAQLVARTTEQYLTVALQLAGDARRLAELRSTLRERMRASPLMDAPGFARDVERAFLEMWSGTGARGSNA